MEFNNEMEKRAFLLQTLLGSAPVLYDILNRGEKEKFNVLMGRLEQADPDKARKVKQEINDEKYERYQDDNSSRLRNAAIGGVAGGAVAGAAAGVPIAYGAENMGEAWARLANKVKDKPTLSSIVNKLKPAEEALPFTFFTDKFGDRYLFNTHIVNQLKKSFDPSKAEELTGVHAAVFNNKPIIEWKKIEATGQVYPELALKGDELAHFIATDFQSKYGYKPTMTSPLKFLKNKDTMKRVLKGMSPKTALIGAPIGFFVGRQISKNNMIDERGGSIPTNSDIHEMIQRAEAKKSKSPVIEIK